MGNFTDTLLRQWGLSPLRGKEMFCIAGPCAAESEAQVLKAAEALKSSGVSAFRAGAWKPRTRPGTFEGKGEEALRWLAKAKKTFGLAVATEVAMASHVEMALKYGIDVMWIGARTTANPFLVQEIAEALRGVNAIVFVKNPINPDVNLWLGAFERMHNCGIERAAAILRGFSSEFSSELRNDPGWHIAIDFKQLMPNVPMFCDPSHIAGRRDRLLQLSQQAINLDFDGVMLEVHPDPKNALSDSRQQITPAEFSTLVQSIQFRQRSASIDDNIRMQALRAQIDELDCQLIETIAKRMDAASKLGHMKKEQNLTVLQTERWSFVLDQMKRRGLSLGLPEKLIEEIAKLLHSQAIDIQQDILNRSSR